MDGHKGEGARRTGEEEKRIQLTAGDGIAGNKKRKKWALGARLQGGSVARQARGPALRSLLPVQSSPGAARGEGWCALRLAADVCEVSARMSGWMLAGSDDATAGCAVPDAPCSPGDCLVVVPYSARVVSLGTSESTDGCLLAGTRTTTAASPPPQNSIMEQMKAPKHDRRRCIEEHHR